MIFFRSAQNAALARYGHSFFRSWSQHPVSKGAKWSVESSAMNEEKRTLLEVINHPEETCPGLSSISHFSSLDFRPLWPFWKGKALIYSFLDNQYSMRQWYIGYWWRQTPIRPVKTTPGPCPAPPLDSWLKSTVGPGGHSGAKVLLQFTLKILEQWILC